MKPVFFIIFGILIFSCCKLPLVDRGPKVETLKVDSTQFQLNPEFTKQTQLSAWQYYSRNTDVPLLLILDCKVIRKNSVLLKDASIRLASQGTLENHKMKQVDLYSNSELEGENYRVEISSCCDNYPIELYLDSIAFVEDRDTSYKSLNIRITK